jgi:hypothetical protein
MEQRDFTAEYYMKKSVGQIQSSSHIKFGNELEVSAPLYNMIISWVKQWHKKGSVVPMK